MVIFHSYVSLPEGKSYENDVNMMWKLYERDMKHHKMLYNHIIENAVNDKKPQNIWTKTEKNTEKHGPSQRPTLIVKKWGCPDRGWTELEILPWPGAQNLASISGVCPSSSWEWWLPSGNLT